MIDTPQITLEIGAKSSFVGTQHFFTAYGRHAIGLEFINVLVLDGYTMVIPKLTWVRHLRSRKQCQCAKTWTTWLKCRVPLGWKWCQTMLQYHKAQMYLVLVICSHGTMQAASNTTSTILQVTSLHNEPIKFLHDNGKYWRGRIVKITFAQRLK